MQGELGLKPVQGIPEELASRTSWETYHEMAVVTHAALD
jgi:hypothetical protein